jgi:hypothetical protein
MPRGEMAGSAFSNIGAGRRDSDDAPSESNSTGESIDTEELGTRKPDASVVAVEP